MWLSHEEKYKMSFEVLAIHEFPTTKRSLNEQRDRIKFVA